jgi:hypothetical protein
MDVRPQHIFSLMPVVMIVGMQALIHIKLQFLD